MLRMAVGHSEDFNPAIAVSEVVAQCTSALGGITPQAGLMFLGPGLDALELHRRIVESQPEIELIGATSGAEMSSVLGL